MLSHSAQMVARAATNIKAVAFVGAAVAVAFTFILLDARSAHAADFTVNSTADPGGGSCTATECTLREAINTSNASTTIDDAIKFNIPSTDSNCNATTDVCTIRPTSLLPAITDKVVIDGYTQPGAEPNDATTNSNSAVLKIELDGTNAGSSAFGLAVSGAGAGGTTIKGLVINRFADDGVFVGIDPDNVTIEGNFIGTSADGDADLGNGSDGVTLLSSGNVVGGPANAAQNVISGNDDNGVAIKQSGATSNTISNNHIGTNAGANEDLGNAESGVFVENAPDNTMGGSSAAGTLNIISGNDQHGVEIIGSDSSGAKVLGNLIGVNLNGTGFSDIGNTLDGVLVSGASEVEVGGAADTTPGGPCTGDCNVISDNGQHGVEISGSSAEFNEVRGNRIGTNINGSSAFGNAMNGVRIVSATDTTIGGTTEEARNVISGNVGNGVFISAGFNASNTRVEGNFIGTNATGTGNLANLHGVRIAGAPDNTVGGTVDAAANTISGNTNQGVFVGSCTCATGNRILRNSIFDNGLLGIELGLLEDGPNIPQDPKDPDTGPNKLQNFPVITSASTTKIEAKLNSRPRKNFTIQFFSNPAADPSGFGEGETFVGEKTVRTNRKGKVSFTFTPQAALSAGEVVSATATRNSTGDTSEFSAARAVE